MNFKQYLNENYNIQIDEEQMKLFEIYYETLIEWNKKMNLTGITDKESVYIKHFIDSLSLVKCCDMKNQSILDVGSGAGFPSVPLKIVFPNLKVTIIDSLKKRITFLEHLTNQLGIDDVLLIHGRVEEHSLRNHYDIVTARAVAKLNVLSELCVPFVKKGGVYIAMKGARYKEEVSENSSAAKTLKVHLENTVLYDLNSDSRALLIYQKVDNTPSKYPRPFNKIKNKPL